MKLSNKRQGGTARGLRDRPHQPPEAEDRADPGLRLRAAGGRGHAAGRRLRQDRAQGAPQEGAQHPQLRHRADQGHQRSIRTCRRGSRPSSRRWRTGASTRCGSSSTPSSPRGRSSARSRPHRQPQDSDDRGRDQGRRPLDRATPEERASRRAAPRARPLSQGGAPRSGPPQRSFSGLAAACRRWTLERACVDLLERRGEDGVLRRRELADPLQGEVQQGVHLLAAEAPLLPRPLDLDQGAARRWRRRSCRPPPPGPRRTRGRAGGRRRRCRPRRRRSGRGSARR